MAATDYAILVGISRYADPHLRKLDGPVRDVKLVYDWLTSDNGDPVPPANITCIVSDEQSQHHPTDDGIPPVYQDFLNAFIRLVRKPDKSDLIRRKNSRLYLYLSGHGFSEKHDDRAHAALYVGNTWIKTGPQWNIYGTYFARWAKNHGLFSEIVLVMDCCRDAELTKVASIPALPKPTDIGVPKDVKLFELYAAARGGKAQERKIAERNNEVHGLLTHAFLHALDHARPGSLTVSTSDIKAYLEGSWTILCGNVPADSPEIFVPSNGEILFSRKTSSNLLQRFRLRTLEPGDTFDIVDSTLDDIMHIVIHETGAQVEPRGGPAIESPIDNEMLVVSLPAGLYLAVCRGHGPMLKQKFQAGGPDVEL